MTLMTLNFRLPDIYGLEYPDLEARVSVERVPREDYQLPHEEYSECDHLGYLLGTWEFVTVHAELYDDTGLRVSFASTGEVPFGEMSGGFSNPLGDPDGFPMKSLIDTAVEG